MMFVSLHSKLADICVNMSLIIYSLSVFDFFSAYKIDQTMTDLELYCAVKIYTPVMFIWKFVHCLTNHCHVFFFFFFF